jgi:asparagine synthase (glutamine-hydrolysing)
MCGITGIVDLSARRNINRGLLRDMNERLTHRGPDGEGYHFEPGVGFGHRRLSIIDLEGGKQPMFNEDGSVVVTFNGEIYEFAHLRDELEKAGHVFQTNCDTEVIVHAWEEWGVDFINHLHGMFAFAIWDRNRQELFIARDRFGKKPLYYSLLPDGQLVFGSELKALLIHPELPREIDATSVKDYMTFGYVPDPKTIFNNVYKLPPGHFIHLRHGSNAVIPAKYWDIRFKEADSSANESDICEELYSRFKQAVEKRLVADVPLGAFLSGGVDSSAVVTAMSELSDDPVRTCSISFGDPAYNEVAHANAVAERLRTTHHVEQVDPDDFDLIDKIIDLYDEPFADSSAIPTYRVCQLARRHVTVALSGDGGDEMFAGYRRYRWHMNEESVRARIPQAVRKGIFGAAGALYPKMDWAPRIFRAKSTLQAIARDSADAYLHSVSILPNDLHDRLFSSEFDTTLKGYRSSLVFDEHLKSCDSDDPLSMVQYLDMKTYLPGDILTKVDRASMAHSLEVRVPLLDAEFAEWACGLPASLKLKKGEGKYIFKNSLNGRVSDDILYRSKMGFAVPLASWFRGPLRESVRSRLLGKSLADTGIFDMAYIERLLDEHCSGRRDHSPPIWALLVFERFCSVNLN